MRRNGFTLIEILVVVLVLALASGAVVLTMGSGRGPARDVAQLASRIAAARETAITSSRPIGLWVSRSGYGFEVYSRGRWRPLQSKEFADRDWPQGTQVAASGLASAGGMNSPGQARISFDNLGLPEAPLSVRISRGGRSAGVDVSGNGDVVIRS
jgi:general secretion pathway protein H